MPKSEEVSKRKKKELEDILDACLDELDDSDSDIDCDDGGNDINDGSSTSPTHCNDAEKRPVFGPPRPPSMKSSQSPPLAVSSPAGGESRKEARTKLESEAEAEEENALKEMMRQMENLFPQSDIDKGTATGDNDNGGNPSMDETVQQLLQQLSQTTGHNSNNSNGMRDSDLNFEALGDEMMKAMGMQQQWEEAMRQDESSGRSGSAPGFSMNDEEQEVMGHVMDGMMRQLLSKDFMYEPMKDICQRFPSWLAENKEKLSQEDYQKYGTQYQYFQQIVHLYDHDPDNTTRLTELMNSLQEYGQPPPDLVSELAPDLEFDSDGMPKFDGMGAGNPMSIPGMDEECCIM